MTDEQKKLLKTNAHNITLMAEHIEEYLEQENIEEAKSTAAICGFAIEGLANEIKRKA